MDSSIKASSKTTMCTAAVSFQQLISGRFKVFGGKTFCNDISIDILLLSSFIRYNRKMSLGSSTLKTGKKGKSEG